MIGSAKLEISREQLVAIVQEWWKRQTYSARDGAPSDAGKSHVVAVEIEDTSDIMRVSSACVLTLELTDAPQG